MRPVYLILISLILLSGNSSHAQDIRWLKHRIATLASPTMHGRGYVQKGREHASNYIVREFKAYGIQPAGRDSSYLQVYTFPVVSFPGEVSLKVGRNDLGPGMEYLVDAASPPFKGEKLKVSTIDMDEISDSTEWETRKTRFNKRSRIYRLNGLDSFYKQLNIRPYQLAGMLPKGAYIVPVHGKMNWDVATDTVSATIFYVQDSVLGKKMKRVTAEVNSKFEPAAKSANVIGIVRGTATPDSFIVFTAHYDHLGRMGPDALFPGASDNASGTAMMLWLAQYYAAHPQKYSMVFIAFSGEEAGLLGSKYYVAHPTIPLGNIRFLVNLDIMGDATDGVTVVNATEFPKEFSLLQSLNRKKEYLPQIRSRGKAANSDHYPFSEEEVPAFFLYSNGGPGFYHDIFDRGGTLRLTNIPNVIRLLQDFVTGLQ